MRVLQPSLEAFRSNRFNDYAETFRVAQADASLDAFFAAVTATGAARHWQRRAVFDVCCALTTQGIGVVDLTPAAFLHYARTARLGGKIFTQRAVTMLSSLFGAARARGMPPLPIARLMVASGLKEAAAAVQSIDPKLATRLLDGPFESTDFANRFLLSAWGTLTARLWPLLTENLVKTFNGHDFSGKQLLLSPKPVGIYLRWPERDLLALSSLVRLIWDSLIGELITAYDSCQGLGYQPILLLVDEAGRAPIPTLADHATTVVGWGISLWLAVQSLSQLEAIYGKARAQVIRDNMDSQVYYRPTDLSTAEYLEKRLGNVSGYAQSATSAPGAAWTVCRRYAVRGLRRAAEFLWVPGLPAG